MHKVVLINSHCCECPNQHFSPSLETNSFYKLLLHYLKEMSNEDEFTELLVVVSEEDDHSNAGTEATRESTSSGSERSVH
jgi:hypothetical protein